MSAEIRADLVDRMIELYCDWRTGCWDVRAAYERFLEAPASERAVAFAAYMAALDREESACGAYAAQVQAIQSRCADAPGSARRRHAKLH
jgi:hypothetical protein